MMSTSGVARLSMLAVSLGLGVAMAHSPVASADSSGDWLSSIDSLLSGAMPAPSSGTDLAISFDGYSPVQEGNAFAFTGTGNYGLAIAYGDGSSAVSGGTGGSAFADGTDAQAFDGGGIGNSAFADGSNALADAGGSLDDTGANYDTAIDIGNNDLPLGGFDDGAYAGNSDLIGATDGGTGSYDTAIDIGNNTSDGSLGGADGSFAGAGGLTSGSGDGNHDTAIDVGNNSGLFDGSQAVGGDGNYASESGSTTGDAEDAYAGFGGNDNTAVSDTSFTVGGDDVYAGGGSDNYAADFGPENSNAIAAGGDSNIAYILDPFGSTASEAYSGFGHSSDLAAVLLTDGNAFATSANNLYDILTAFGLESGTF
jgi:hypothetical protein